MARTAARTRERLIEGAREVIERDGYAGASVAAIADAAGLASGTLYRHFPSKAALFVEVFRTVAEREIEAMEEAGGEAASATECLDAIVASYASRALRHPRLAWALVYEPVDPVVDAERLAYRREYCGAMAGVLCEGIARGEFPDQDADLAAAAIVGAIAETLVGPLSPLTSRTASEEELVRSIVGLCRRTAGAVTVPAVAAGV